MKKLLIQYRRISSHKQISGKGIQAQTLSQLEIAGLCQEYGLEPHSEAFEDNAVSGFKVNASDRPAFSRLLDLIESGTISKDSVIVLSNIDRLSRAHINDALSTMMRVLQNAHIYLVHENKLVRRDSPDLLTQLIMVLVGMERSYNESLTKSLRGKTNVRMAVDNHLLGNRGPNNKPLRIPSYNLPIWIKTVGKELYIDEPTANLIREAIQRLIDGEGVMSVYEWIRQHPYPKKGKEWKVDIIRRLHYKETLYGKCVMNVNGSCVELPNYIEPIITRQQFLKLVEVRSMVNRQTKRIKEDVSIFTGYGASFCRSCGSPMTTTMCKGRVRIQCSSVFSNGYQCSNPVRTEESYILEAINKFVLAPVFKEELQPNTHKDELELLNMELMSERDALAKIESQYEEHQHDFLIKFMLKKTVTIKNIEEKIEALQVPVELDDLSALASIPTSRIEIRDIYRKILSSVRFYKLGRGKVILSVYTRYNFNISVLFHNGKVKKVGTLTGSCSSDSSLEDDLKFTAKLNSGDLKDWINQ